MASIAQSSSLFEIDLELDLLLDAIQEEIATNGKASDELEQRFQEFLKAQGEKVDRIGRFLCVMEARSNHCKAEAKRLYDRARTAENKCTRTKGMVLYYLKARGLAQIDGIEFTLQQRKNSQDSVRILNEEELPIRYKRIQVSVDGDFWETLLETLPAEFQKRLQSGIKESTPNNEAIKAAVLRREDVPGAEVKRGEHIRLL